MLSPITVLFYLITQLTSNLLIIGQQIMNQLTQLKPYSMQKIGI